MPPSQCGPACPTRRPPEPLRRRLVHARRRPRPAAHSRRPGPPYRRSGPRRLGTAGRRPCHGRPAGPRRGRVPPSRGRSFHGTQARGLGPPCEHHRDVDPARSASVPGLSEPGLGRQGSGPASERAQQPWTSESKGPAFWNLALLGYHSFSMIL
jgi:hypothetical protein